MTLRRLFALFALASVLFSSGCAHHRWACRRAHHRPACCAPVGDCGGCCLPH